MERQLKYLEVLYVIALDEYHRALTTVLDVKTACKNLQNYDPIGVLSQIMLAAEEVCKELKDGGLDKCDWDPLLIDIQKWTYSLG